MRLKLKRNLKLTHRLVFVARVGPHQHVCKKKPHQLVFASRVRSVGCCCVRTAHRLVFVARVGPFVNCMGSLNLVNIISIVGKKKKKKNTPGGSRHVTSRTPTHLHLPPTP
jgi:hypothetical protein